MKFITDSLILNQLSDGSSPPILLVFAGIFIGVGLTVFGLSLIVEGRKKSTKIWGILIFLISLTCFIWFAIFVFNSSKYIKEASSETTTQIQEWIQDTYMIEITDEQAQELYKNRIDSIENLYDNDSKKPALVVKDALGKKIGVFLVKIKNTPI